MVFFEGSCRAIICLIKKYVFLGKCRVQMRMVMLTEDNVLLPQWESVKSYGIRIFWTQTGGGILSSTVKV